jgi:hypothetical protein
VIGLPPISSLSADDLRLLLGSGLLGGLLQILEWYARAS